MTNEPTNKIGVRLQVQCSTPTHKILVKIADLQNIPISQVANYALNEWIRENADKVIKTYRLLDRS